MSRDMVKHGFCYHLPLPLFAAVMGLSGLGLVWHAVEARWHLPPLVSSMSTGAAVLVFALLAVGYSCKWLRYPDRVMAELRHPVRINFLPAISISLILLGLLLRDWAPPVATALWMLGAALQLLLTVIIVTIWLETERPLPSMNPAWFIPAVGNILVPLAAAPAGYTMVAWFFMATGLFFWGMLITLVFFRLVTGPQLEPPMRPTLAVMLAPPSVAFMAWLSLTGGTGIPGHLLYFIGLLTFLLLIPQVPGFLRLPYFPSWWAYTFPLAAFTASSFQFAESGSLQAGIPLGLLAALTTVVILLVTLRTLIAIARGELAE
ncbi:MAG: SLAC1 anion channel family protein [Ectothiorhodospiraceae bacterium]|nr:SLAC1 anion channel family protein [Ectothiorhodospiraceae bacterium]MCH8506049.1 SLAC1 anion channel family protein [Ectothiorhodospiraceae bacterium]